jgi:anti-sigma factor RsiW
MDCSQARAPLTACVDGELPPAQRARLEAHVGRCAKCRRLREQQRFTSDRVRREATRHVIPAAFESRLRRAIAEQAPPPRLAWLRWPVLPTLIPRAGVALASAAIAAGGMALAQPGEEQRVAGDALASHVRSLLAASAIDVVSSDEHTVKPWFAGRLDFSPPVTDFAAEGFTLVGARRDYVGGRTVAALVYQCRRHLVDVFVWPEASGDPGPRWNAPRQGYHLLHWTHDGLAYWAVSDLETHDLERLQRLLASRTTP